MEMSSLTCPAGGVVHSHRLQHVPSDHRQVICTVCGDLGWVEDREAADKAARRHMADGGSDGRLTATDLHELAGYSTYMADLLEAGAIRDRAGGPTPEDLDEAARLRALAARARGHAAPAVDERARIRERLLAEARLENLKVEAAKRVAGAPYAGPEAAIKYREVLGRWCGIHRAIEIIDRINQQET